MTCRANFFCCVVTDRCPHLVGSRFFTDENQFGFQQDESSNYSFEAPTANDFSDDYSIVEETSEEDSVTSFDTSFQQPAETVEEALKAPVQTETVSTPPFRPRFGDRNVDLPIEVKEDERRLHNDSR